MRPILLFFLVHICGIVAMAQHSGAVDSTFQSPIGYGPDSYYIEAVGSKVEGKAWFLGSFFHYSGYRSQGIVRLLPNGDPDTNFRIRDTQNYYYINSLIELENGSSLAIGYITFPGQLGRCNMIGLQPDGRIDTTFTPLRWDDQNRSYFCQTESFFFLKQTASGTKPAALLRYRMDGTLDSSFTCSEIPSRIQAVENGKYMGLFSNKLKTISSNGQVETASIITGISWFETLPNGHTWVARYENGIQKINCLRRNGSLFFSDWKPVQSVQFLSIPDSNGALFYKEVNASQDSISLMRIDSTGQSSRIFSTTNWNAFSDGSKWAGTQSGEFCVVGLSQDGFEYKRWNAQGMLVVHRGEQLKRKNIQGVFPLPDRRILVTGDFEDYQGYSSPGLVRLMPDGGIDTTFRCSFFKNGTGNQLYYYLPNHLVFSEDGSIWTIYKKENLWYPGIVHFDQNGQTISNIDFPSDSSYTNFIFGMSPRAGGKLSVFVKNPVRVLHFNADGQKDLSIPSKTFHFLEDTGQNLVVEPAFFQGRDKKNYLTFSSVNWFLPGGNDPPGSPFWTSGYIHRILKMDTSFTIDTSFHFLPQSAGKVLSLDADPSGNCTLAFSSMGGLIDCSYQYGRISPTGAFTLIDSGRTLRYGLEFSGPLELTKGPTASLVLTFAGLQSYVNLRTDTMFTPPLFYNSYNAEISGVVPQDSNKVLVWGSFYGVDNKPIQGLFRMYYNPFPKPANPDPNPIDSLPLQYGIYPNPGGSRFWIRDQEPGACTVYDITGKRLISTVSYPDKGIGTHNLPCGMYFVRYNTKSGIKTARWIKYKD
jgi:hypothetical protein